MEKELKSKSSAQFYIVISSLFILASGAVLLLLNSSNCRGEDCLENFIIFLFGAVVALGFSLILSITGWVLVYKINREIRILKQTSEIESIYSLKKIKGIARFFTVISMFILSAITFMFMRPNYRSYIEQRTEQKVSMDYKEYTEYFSQNRPIKRFDSCNHDHYVYRKGDTNPVDFKVVCAVLDNNIKVQVDGVFSKTKEELQARINIFTQNNISKSLKVVLQEEELFRENISKDKNGSIIIFPEDFSFE